jgi:adenylate cyclase
MLRTVPRRGFIFRAEVVAKSKEATSTDTAASRDKPSVAVLPFANMSSQPEQDYFSDGVADDIITNLSSSSSLLVTARTSSFAYRGRPIDVKQVAHELGVRYVVEGSVRREADQLRINARLISAEMGTPLWSERYDRTITEVFAVQDEIVAAVTKAIVPAVADAEQLRALRRPPERLGAWEACQRGLWHLSKFSGANLAFAREFFEQAIGIDPTFAAARSHLAMTYIEEGFIYVMRPPGEAITLAAAVAAKALDYDPTDADAQATAAFATLVTGSSERVAERLSHALASNPNSPWVNGVQGLFLVWSGHTREGRQYLHTALRLSPRDPYCAWFRHQIVVSYYFECDYIHAAEAAQEAITLHAYYPQPYRWLAASLGQLGRSSEAHAALQQAREVSPASFEIYVDRRPAWFRADQHEHLLDGLRRAGWRG